MATRSFSWRTVSTFLAETVAIMIALAAVYPTVQSVMVFVDGNARPLVPYGQLYALLVGSVGFGIVMAATNVAVHFRKIRQRPT